MDEIIEKLAQTVETVSNNSEKVSELLLDATDKSQRRYESIIKKLIIALCIAIGCLVIEHGFTLLYLYQYDFSGEVTTTTTVEQDAWDGGNANYIGGNGDITNGKAESNEKGDDKENP